MSTQQHTGDDPAYVDAVTVLAAALDQLGARIHRDLHVDSSYINVTDPRLVATLAEFSAYADECLTALDDPAVISVLDTAGTRRNRQSGR
ncbi:hypothetical protein Q0Z83_000140 [Actinoplanes sichuanensis]|uniref:Uncharacterized protein n=1 Tax=Actinoplanes sichuanensis TaxID=512349 RepID=A0ABW4A189_9ACTN|nr:hypothetical protein [Actinoplanes sichuanensis]BEL01823.1 hypothetical protein Q0Z83_000140 [Actinoplanes sichuanensis]